MSAFASLMTNFYKPLLFYRDCPGSKREQVYLSETVTALQMCYARQIFERQWTESDKRSVRTPAT